MNKTFKLTAIAAAIAAVTACSSDDKKNSPAPGANNPNIKNAVFDASSYTPVDGSLDKDGSWVLATRSVEAEDDDERTTTRGGAFVRAVDIQDYIAGEGQVYIQENTCDEGEGNFWGGNRLLTENEGDGVFVQAEGYVNGECPAETECYRFEVEFSSDTEASFSYVADYTEGDYSQEVVETGTLIKVSNESTSSLWFSEGDVDYSNYDEGASTISANATCLSYLATGSKTRYDNGDKEDRTFDALYMDTTHEGYFQYGASTSEYDEGYVKDSAHLYVSAYDDVSNNFDVDFYNASEGIPGTGEYSESSEFSVDEVSFTEGKFVVKGSGNDTIGDYLDFNIGIYLNSLEIDL